MSAVVLGLHVLEEFLLGFHEVDRFCRWVCMRVAELAGGEPEAAFAVFQLMLLVLAIVVSLMILGERSRLACIGVLGLLLVGELQHLIETIRLGGYHPGTMSGVVLFVLGLATVREVVRCWQAGPDDASKRRT